MRYRSTENAGPEMIGRMTDQSEIDQRPTDTTGKRGTKFSGQENAGPKNSGLISLHELT